MTTSIIPSKYKPWVSPQLRSLIRKRDKAYKKSKGSNNPELVDIFEDLRSRVSNALDTAKNQYLSSQLSTAKSLKARWNTRKKMGTTKSALPSPFNYFTPNDLNLHFASTVNHHPPVTLADLNAVLSLQINLPLNIPLFSLSPTCTERIQTAI